MTEPAVPTQAQILGLLREGPEAFNHWRLAHMDAEIDLRGASLRGMTLDQAMLAGARLDGASLVRASLRGTVFSGASLVGANLSDADLSHAVFGPPELFNAELIGTPLGTHLCAGADLTDAHLRHAWLYYTSFRECSLAGSDLGGCDLSLSDLRNVDLETIVQGDGNDAFSDTDRVLGLLRDEPLEIRRAIVTTLFTVGVADGWTPDTSRYIGQSGMAIGFEADEIRGLAPEGDFVLADIKLPVPATADAREAWLRLACWMISSNPVGDQVLEVVAYWLGDQLGFPLTEVCAVLRRTTGTSIAPAASTRAVPW